MLDQFFRAPVQKADMRIGAPHHLSVKLEHKAQHAMGRRMLRPEVERIAVDQGFGHQVLPAPLAPSALASTRSGLIGKNVLGALPWAHEIEGAEFLGQRHGLVHDALLFVVVAHLDESGEREILAQRMAFKTIVGEEAAQIGVAGKKNAVHVPRFALEPAGAREDAARRRYRYALAHLELHPDTLIVGEAQKIVDDVEAALAVGVIDAADVDKHAEPAVRIVAQEGQDRNNRLGRGLHGQFAVRHRCRRNRIRQGGGDGLAKFYERFVHNGGMASG